MSGEFVGITVQTKGDYIVSPFGYKIFCRTWEPNDSKNIKALIFLCHDYAEHSELYSDLGTHLAENNFLVFSHDHQGHGLSEGKRGVIVDWNQVCSNVLIHVARMKNAYGPKPCIALGHSLGAAVVLRATRRNQRLFRGIILSCPAVWRPMASLQPLGHILNLPIPSLCLVSKFIVEANFKLMEYGFPGHLEYNEAVVEEGFRLVAGAVPFVPEEKESERLIDQNDPLCIKTQMGLRTKLAKETFLQDTWSNMKTIRPPMFVLQKTDDPNMNRTEALLAKTNCLGGLKVTSFYTSSGHLLRGEEDIKQAVFGQVHEWIDDVLFPSDE